MVNPMVTHQRCLTRKMITSATVQVTRRKNLDTIQKVTLITVLNQLILVLSMVMIVSRTIVLVWFQFQESKLTQCHKGWMAQECHWIIFEFWWMFRQSSFKMFVTINSINPSQQLNCTTWNWIRKFGQVPWISGRSGWSFSIVPFPGHVWYFDFMVKVRADRVLSNMSEGVSLLLSVSFLVYSLFDWIFQCYISMSTIFYGNNYGRTMVKLAWKYKKEQE